ncbi:MAG: ATP-binding protein, partial [Bacteroidota bacterium]
MEIQDVRRWVAQGESEKIEFKRKVTHPEKIVKELVAFANTSGGYLFIGVNDDGSIPGVKFPEDEIFALDRAIDKFCRPPLEITSETIPLSEKKSIIVYKVKSGSKKPYYILEDRPQHKKTTFVRSSDKSIQASKEVREIIRRRQKNKDITFNFGDKEKLLMDYLEKNGSITLQEFKKVANLNHYTASKTLIIL